MILEGLVDALTASSSFDEALTYASSDADFSLVDGLRAPLIAGLAKRRVEHGHSPCIVALTATSREAEQLSVGLASMMPQAQIIELPAWETLPHEHLSPSAEVVGRRIHALTLLQAWADGAREHPFVLLTSVRAALQPLATGITSQQITRLAVGSRGYDLTNITEHLVDLAYTRVDMVTRRGEFAVRGGILDVFPPVSELPVRIDFFGDEVDEMRAFSVGDQRSLPAAEHPVETVELLPARELLLTPAVRERAAALAESTPSLAGMLTKVADGIPVEGMESLAPVLADGLVPLTHYLPDDSAIAVLSPERVATRGMHLAETNREFLDAAWSAASAGAEAPIDLAAGDFLSLSELRVAAADRSWWTLSAFDAGAVAAEEGAGADADGYVHIAGDAVGSFQGSVDGAVSYVADRLADGWRVVVAAEGAGLVDRAADVLAERGLAARAVDAITDDLDAGVAYAIQAGVSAGFAVPELKLALLAEAEFYGHATSYESRGVRKLASRRRNVVDPLQLKPGDFVVHQTHGIGRFVELTQREVSTGGRHAQKTTREYVVLEYAPSKRGRPGDKLHVPTDQLDLLTRYVGGEAPALSKMGGSDWAAAKGRARKAVRDIAVELVKLYAARQNSRGHAFSPDTPWQHELEDAFPFIETPDQMQTIDDVKADMERARPMDRLISGDVGFGKTEIAVRAAFKAVQDGKQVAMLVPTTLLVRQHVETLQERFAGFPVHLRALSRFQTDREAREVLAGLADGTIDVVVGTHRLLSEGVRFKDLGLVVLDEEQRFGVEHKDALKKLKTNVDVLAMSATPIPRTLEMAVTGIREMSTLATPPEQRHPILTYVGPRSDKQLAAAIRREMLREGQVFFVHNRVSSINRVAAQLAELVPEARIAVAHGKMSERSLEQVVLDFWERKYDVLVSTTIIETGLDIANANTIIIDRADRYGLSQLHQLRGRVGRSRERAYAYFLYDGDKPLSETAQDRLETIAANNELGAGMQVALKDLELRGAGNMLGGEQSGHIAGVGFDLYLRMIGEAVDTFRGEEVSAATELRLELPVDARITDDYIDSERLRLEAYQKLSAATSAPLKEDRADPIDLVRDELTDRYGAPPEEVAGLFDLARLRRRAQQAGLTEVVVMGRRLRLAHAELPESKQMRLKRLYPGARYFSQQTALAIPLPQRDGEALPDAELIAWVGGIFDALFPADAAQAS